jgi:hypothetical protein
VPAACLGKGINFKFRRMAIVVSSGILITLKDGRKFIIDKSLVLDGDLQLFDWIDIDC